MRRRRYMQGSGEPPAIYNETDAEFYYRQTGGGAIIDNSPLVGRFDKIKGNTIAWNQLLYSDLSDSNNYVCNGNTTASYSNGVLTVILKAGSSNAFGIYGKNFVGGHKVYAKFVGTTESPNIKYGASRNVGWTGETTDVSTFNNIRTLNTAATNVTSAIWFFISSTSAPDQTITISSLLFFDLTLIYGAGNEPSTPEQFEADYFKWFGKPLTYEPYDEGSLRSVKMSGLKTIGFNQWDEEWEAGSFNTTTGVNISSTTLIRSKNYIKVLPNTQYHCYFENSVGAINFWMMFFDSNKNVITEAPTGAGSGSANVFDVINKTITTQSNCAYVRFYTKGTTYNNDICINRSNANKNGTYETHWSETRNIPITTLTGKVNGQGESVVVFPDGMLSAGNVHDEIYKQGGKTYAIKRVGRVDLGSLQWVLVAETAQYSAYFYATILGIKNISAWSSKLNAICSNYSQATGNDTIYKNTPDKLMGGQPSTKNIRIKDSSHSTVPTAQDNWLEGVYFDYELAEPIIYELDDFTLPVSYNCAALGTEEILPENTSTPASVAPIVDTSYRLGHVAEKPWYGIKWSEDNGQMQRIASNMELHATLPIQSKMKRCMLLDNGNVYKYISDADPFLYEDGTSVKYDGTDGQVMVEVPAYWYTAYKETDENNITWNYLKLYPKGGGQMYSRKIYRGAFEMITDNSDNSAAKGCSVSMLDFASMGTTKDTTSFVASAMKYLSAATSYRNWNYGVVDPTNVKNSLGKPTTGRNRATFRSIAARRGAGFSQEYWDSYNSLIRLYVVEYCNFDIQASINDSLTIEGFKQGGLGAGVTNAESAKWYNFNDYNSFVPCGVTVPLGNKSGAISYAFINYDFHNVNITYSVPSYRGIENPFGHIWKFIDGFNRKGKVENNVTTEMIYVCDTVSKFAEDNADGYVLQSDTAPRENGNFGGVTWNAKGTFWPKLGGRTMYSDYFYNAYANNTWYTLFGGGYATSGSYAGLFCLYAPNVSGHSYVALSSRLLYTK